MMEQRWAWENRVLAAHESGDSAWKYQRPISASSLNGAKLTVYNDELVDSNYYLNGSLASERKRGDGIIVVSGPNPDNETYIVQFKPGQGEWTELGIDVFQDESLPGQPSLARRRSLRTHRSRSRSIRWRNSSKAAIRPRHHHRFRPAAGASRDGRHRRQCQNRLGHCLRRASQRFPGAALRERKSAPVPTTSLPCASTTIPNSAAPPSAASAWRYRRSNTRGRKPAIRDARTGSPKKRKPRPRR